MPERETIKRVYLLGCAFRKFLPGFILAILAILAFASIGRVLTKGIISHEIDFHSYWYAGHFIWEGEDPYQAVFEGREPRLPVRYWDGLVVTTGKIAQEHLATMPANTAPIVLLLTLFSRLSWPTAATVWACINVVLALIVGVLTGRVLGYTWHSLQAMFILLSFLSLIATREAIETGQTSLLVLACSLGALFISDSRPWVAGILLGIGLSKYSLSFPFFLCLALQRRFLTLIVGLAVQISGVALINIISHSSPFEVLSAYLHILRLHAGLPGFHLTATLLRGLGVWSTLIIGLGSAILWVTVFTMYKRSRRGLGSIDNFAVLTLAMVWNLLVFYHRRYDHIGMVLFIGLSSLWVWEDPMQRLQLSRPLRKICFVLTFIFLGVWILPLYIVLGQAVYTLLFVLCTVLALFLTLLIWFTATSTIHTVGMGVK